MTILTDTPERDPRWQSSPNLPRTLDDVRNGRTDGSTPERSTDLPIDPKRGGLDAYRFRALIEPAAREFIRALGGQGRDK